MGVAILIDWGTTNVRAWARDADGRIVGRRSAPLGIRNVADGRFADAFAQVVSDWADGAAAVLMSGMIGSRQGWVEAPYVACPADLSAIAGALTPVPGFEGASIVPGVCRGGGDAARDVMRGEEVQCLGVLAVEGLSDALLCLPGTHSKWVSMAGGAIANFATAMTGEAYAVLRGHSILGALMAEPAAGTAAGAGAEAFGRGVARSGEPGGLLNHLFSVRAEGLFGEIAGEALPAYLSGILIGHEIRAMAALFERGGEVLVVGDAALREPYLTAFALLDVPARTCDAERATLAGLSAILDRAG